MYAFQLIACFIIILFISGCENPDPVWRDPSNAAKFFMNGNYICSREGGCYDEKGNGCDENGNCDFRNILECIPSKEKIGTIEFKCNGEIESVNLYKIVECVDCDSFND